MVAMMHVLKYVTLFKKTTKVKVKNDRNKNFEIKNKQIRIR